MSLPSPELRQTLALERYSFRRKLGSGSLGSVYLVVDERSGREVALKLIRKDRLSSPAVARLQEEFQALAALRHLRIASAYDFGYTRDGSLLSREESRTGPGYDQDSDHENLPRQADRTRPPIQVQLKDLGVPTLCFV